jgi:glycosyltransferase involved in cell wall biosynthesis
LLSGNPVVVTRVGDIPRFIEDGISGMIAEPSNPEDFSSKIIWLLEHPDEAVAIGQKGRMVAEKNFNNEIEARKIVDVIFSD